MNRTTRIVALVMAMVALAGARRLTAAQNDTNDAKRLGLTLLAGDVEEKVMNFLGSHRAHRDAILSLSQCRNCHQADVGAAVNAAAPALQPQGPWIGISVAPADGVLRSQLRLPEGSGVIITQVLPNSPAQQAGVEPHDVLLAVNGKPVASADDLEGQIRSATTGGTLELKLLRGGKPLDKQVTPQTQAYADWLQALSSAGQPVYRIGVSMSPPDETLRKQLGLAGGFVVTEVNVGSPAEAAGVKAGDVLLSANGKALAEEGDLGAEIQRGTGSPVALEVMRAGATLRLSVTPVKETPPPQATAAALTDWVGRDLAARELMLVHPTYIDLLAQNANPATQPAAPVDRLQQITDRLEQLRQAVDALRQEVQQQKEAKPQR